MLIMKEYYNIKEMNNGMLFLEKSLLWRNGTIVLNIRNNNLCQIASKIKYVDVNNKCWFWVDDLVDGTTYYISERKCIKVGQYENY